MPVATARMAWRRQISAPAHRDERAQLDARSCTGSWSRGTLRFTSSSASRRSPSTSARPPLWPAHPRRQAARRRGAGAAAGDRRRARRRLGLLLDRARADPRRDPGHRGRLARRDRRPDRRDVIAAVGGRKPGDLPGDPADQDSDLRAPFRSVPRSSRSSATPAQSDRRRRRGLTDERSSPRCAAPPCPRSRRAEARQADFLIALTQ
jgi:hypothetical protein